LAEGEVRLQPYLLANNLAAVSGLTSPEETHFAGSGLASAALLLIVMGMTAHFVRALRPHEER
jgi:hypothetical protein